MKVLLTAINAKYIHTNLAIYYLRAYAKKYRSHIKLCQFTINHYADDILQAIYKEKPDFIGFSCYIWNIGMIKELCAELRKILPQVKIWLGGPEVSFDARESLNNMPSIDGIMIGEGEATFLELLDYYIGKSCSLEEIKGISYRQSAFAGCTNVEADIKVNPLREEIDFNTLPFPYENMEEFKNRIIYYETSRGCPYSCSYCLSSVDKKVRLRDMNLVKEELGIFLRHQVPQVKFVDRTFNCNRSHAMAIWEFIKEQDNGITNFHFEISADILGEEELELLSTLRKGLVQLEIGVQSTNPDTIKAITRHMDLDKLKYAVNRIHKARNIHQHLDLIAGLPKEGLESFQKSFDYVYSLKPDQLQLGFLKVLKGSAMKEESRRWGIAYKETAPYEVLYTKWLSYDEVLTLKRVEEMVEVYYNSGQFEYTLKYLEHFFHTPYELYYNLGEYYEKYNLFNNKHARIHRYEILIDFMKEFAERNKGMSCRAEIQTLKNILVHDLYLRENLKSRPVFADEYEAYKKRYHDFYRDEQKVREYMRISEEDIIKPEQFKPYMHLEHYNIDIGKTALSGEAVKADQFLLYDYLHRNQLNSQARVVSVIL